jgi:predicted transcriptional regulator
MKPYTSALDEEQSTVEQGMQELWEMFGDKRDYEIRLRSWGYRYLVHVATNAGLRMDFKAETLKECMAQVREWKKSQKQ